MRTHWQRENPTHWEFWLRWWDGALSGDQLDWKLQEAVALIPGDVWKAGPGAVAEAIFAIEEELQNTATSDRQCRSIAPRGSRGLHVRRVEPGVMRMVPFEEDIPHLR